ncbi:MAG TPA: glutamyl-tRNA reductase [Steroidobacteraceae bacterium]|nr:glutamyl-tRNA reductase [Steroidobacteraceae bacterium]
MPFLVLGINHRTAPVEVREKVVFAGEELPEALAELARLPDVREAAIVSTCNRTELYCYVEAPGVELDGWLEEWHELSARSIHSCLYRLEGPRAVAHAFSVASGLDSMIIGEPQILGQLKDAYREAQHCGTAGPYLHRLFQAAFSVAKRIRTGTRIGSNAVSVASAAIALARTIFEKFDERTALLVGAGETITLAARHLHAQGLKRMIVANRSIERARDLAAEFSGYAVSLDSLAAHLPDADIVVSSTASPTPVITMEAARAAIKARKRRPIYMLDIAVPRDIEPEVGELADVYLFTIDDLQGVVNENLESRRQAARDADRLIAVEVDRFEMHMRTLDAVPTIRALRHDAQALKEHTLDQARRMLANGRAPAEVLDFLAFTLTNRLIHTPSQRLRQAAEGGDGALIEAARELFALADTEERHLPPADEHESIVAEIETPPGHRRSGHR